MISVHAVQLWKVAVGVPVCKIVPPVNVAPDGVETVHRVDNVEFGNVGVRAESPVLWPFGRLAGVFTEAPHVFGADGVGELVRDALPCRVYFERWGLAIYGRLAVQKRAVDGGIDERDLYLVIYGC